MKRSAWWLPLILLILVLPHRTLESQASDQEIVVTDVRVFDGLRVVPRTTVVIRNHTIVSIGQRPSTQSATRIDGTGHTIIPGFIDGHSHVSGNREALRDAARFGVTTVVDLFGSPRRMQALRLLVQAEPSDAEADYAPAGGGATVKGGHGDFSDEYPTISSPVEADGFVASRIAEGSQYIKIIVERGVPEKPLPTLDATTVKALIDAAHRRGKLAIVHASRADDARMAVVNGADGLAHLWWESQPGQDDEELVKQIKARGVFVIPTLVVLESLSHGNGSASLLADPRLAPYLSTRARANLEPASAAPPAEPMSKHYENVRRLYRGAVPIVVGTDAGNPGVEHGISFHRELELLVDAGMAPIDALKAATSVAASMLRLTGHGRIVPNASADVILVKGDPTSDILATRNIVSIWKGGKRLERQFVTR